jgi:hypothetical protein
LVRSIFRVKSPAGISNRFEPNVKGVFVRIDRVQIEPSGRGAYDWSLVDHIAATAAAAGK